MGQMGPIFFGAKCFLQKFSSSLGRTRLQVQTIPMMSWMDNQLFPSYSLPQGKTNQYVTHQSVFTHNKSCCMNYDSWLDKF